MEEVEEQDPVKRALELLGILSSQLPSVESAVDGASLPDWLMEPWASRLADLDDPNLKDAVLKAEQWLQSH